MLQMWQKGPSSTGVPQEKGQESKADACGHCSGGGTSQIANLSLLANIKTAKNLIMVLCNNGLSYTNLEGNLGGMTVYQKPIRYCERPVVGVDQGQVQGALQ